MIYEGIYVYRMYYIFQTRRPWMKEHKRLCWVIQFIDYYTYYMDKIILWQSLRILNKLKSLLEKSVCLKYKIAFSAMIKMARN